MTTSTPCAVIDLGYFLWKYSELYASPIRCDNKHMGFSAWPRKFQIYRLLEGASSSGAIRQLPSLLTQGASSLEIARRTNTPVRQVDELLSDLSQYGVVESQSTGAGLPDAARVYHITSDGILFFRELEQALLDNARSIR